MRNFEFPGGADRQPDRHVRRHGLVSGHVRRHGRRPPGISSCSLSLAYLILVAAYFLSGHRRTWLAPVRNAVPLGCPRGFHPDASGAGRRAGQALRRRHHGTRLQGKRSIDRLFDLLHLVNIGGAAGPYVASWAHRHLRRGECLPGGCAQRLRNVFRGPVVLSGTASGRRCASTCDSRPWPGTSALSWAITGWFFRCLEFPDISLDQFWYPVRVWWIWQGFYRACRHQLLHVVPGPVHRPRVVFWQQYISLPGPHPRAYQRATRMSVHSRDRRFRDLPDAADELPDSQDSGFSGHHPGHADNVCFVADPRLLDRLSGAVLSLFVLALGEIIQSTALLRVHFAPGSARPAGDVHGFRLSADRNRIHRSAAGSEETGPSFRRSYPPTRTDVVACDGGGHRHCWALVDLRQDPEACNCCRRKVNS